LFSQSTNTGITGKGIKQMKKNLLLVCLIIGVSFSPLVPGCSRDQSNQTEPDPVSSDTGSGNGPLAATVNGAGIFQLDLERAVTNVLIQNGMDASHTAAFMDQFGPRILEQLIQGELLYQEATKSGYEPDSVKIEEVISGLSGRHGSKEEFYDELKMRGFTEDSLKDSIRKQLAIQRYVEETIVPEAIVPEEAVRAAYDQNPQNFQRPEQVRASHILIKSDESDSQEEKDEALEKATEIAALARQEGTDFAVLASKHSEGPSATRGGDLDYFSRGRMVKPFEEKAFSMKVGEISNPVLTKFGYHVIYLTDRRDGVTIPFEEVRGKLGADLKNRLVNELINRKVEELKADARIEVLYKPASPESQPPQQD
jgi:peptidyl-prolyl cis-trans isomerase C